ARPSAARSVAIAGSDARTSVSTKGSPSAHVDLVAVRDDPIAANQLYAQLTQRLGVERDLLAAPSTQQRPPAPKHDVEARADGREIETRAVFARDQRSTAIEPARNAQDQHAVRELEVDRAFVTEPEPPGPDQRDLPGERQAGQRRAVARVEIAQLEARAEMV